MKKCMEKLESLLELGGTRKDIAFLVISGVALHLHRCSNVPLPFDLGMDCHHPVRRSHHSGGGYRPGHRVRHQSRRAGLHGADRVGVCIGEDFAAGEVAFIMQLGALLEDLTVAKARAGIEKLVHLTPQTARVMPDGRRGDHPGRAGAGRRHASGTARARRFRWTA